MSYAGTTPKFDTVEVTDAIIGKSVVSSLSQNILNNATNEEILTITNSFRSAFITFEIFREDSLNSYSETGQLALIFKNNNWSIATGISQGDEIVNASGTQGVSFSVTNSAGTGILKYTSGNMGSSYSGTIKFIITKVKAT